METRDKVLRSIGIGLEIIAIVLILFLSPMIDAGWTRIGNISSSRYVEVHSWGPDLTLSQGLTILVLVVSAIGILIGLVIRRLRNAPARPNRVFGAIMAGTASLLLMVSTMLAIMNCPPIDASVSSLISVLLCYLKSPPALIGVGFALVLAVFTRSMMRNGK